MTRALRRQRWQRIASMAMAFGLFVFGLVIAPPALSANTCASPGRDGPTYFAPTYYPAGANIALAGQSQAAVATARVDANASNVPILPGDLVLIIQMQDGTFSNTDSSGYGDGSSGRGVTSLGNAGRYEFKTVSAVVGNVLTFTTPLAYTYTTVGATTTQGQRSYQIIRVPQFSSVTISGTVSAPLWNGSTGGVYVIDVTGTLTLNGTIDVSGKGFRGGGAFTNGALLGQNVTEYAAILPLTPTVTPALGATKGEGIGGTPRLVAPSNPLVAGIVDLLLSAYPLAYDNARGAPGNAGGGGDQHNAGGGGGGNAGTGLSSDGGGTGGLTYLVYSATPIALHTCYPFTSGSTTFYGCDGDNGRAVGGLGGAAVPASIGRLFMGGGGGAGDVNDTDNPGTPQNSGGNGGGIVFVRAGAIAGSGTLRADGAAGFDSGRDGAGGGGAGGAIVVHAPAGSYNVTASARGGAGGRSGYLVANSQQLQGPGGGGGGGMVVTASGVGIGSQTATGGAAGTDTPVPGISNTYGATSGGSGVSNLSAAIADPLGSACLPALTITKTATTPIETNTIVGVAVPYVVTITNTGLGTANGVDLLDTLPTGLTLTTTGTATLNGGATGPVVPVNSGTTTVPDLGTYVLPSNASVVLSFSPTAASSVTGVVSNVGTVRYLDPTRTVATGKVAVNSTAALVTINGAPTTGGTVYLDANHDAILDNSEAGIGLGGLYVKSALSVGGVCQAPALQALPVDPTTGTYNTGAIGLGSYCLILSNNTTLTDLTAYKPTGMLATEVPTGIRQVTVTLATSAPQNFGFYAGSSLSGTIFVDNGAGGGTANDGVMNGSEAGIASTNVVIVSGGATVATATTDSSGNYTTWIPSSVSGTLSAVETVASTSFGVSGTPGTTGGTWARAGDATTFTYVAGQTWTGVNFGNVPVNTLSTTGAQTAAPGAVVPYPHTFVAGSAGTVSFTTSASSTPSAAWTETLVQDSNCNGVADAGEPLLTAPVAVTAGQTVCVVVRDNMPAGVTNGAVDVVTLSASMSYANASPAVSQAVTRTDTTTVSTATLLQLVKQVQNLTQSGTLTTSNTAAPNDLLQYQVTVTNPAANVVTTIIVNDATPTYTGFVSAACPGTLPAGITGCTVTAQPVAGAQGAVQWTFTGSLAASSALSMTYQVRVSQ